MPNQPSLPSDPSHKPKLPFKVLYDKSILKSTLNLAKTKKDTTFDLSLLNSASQTRANELAAEVETAIAIATANGTEDNDKKDSPTATKKKQKKNKKK